MKQDYFSLNYEKSYFLVQRLWFSGQKQWATFQISDINLDPEGTKCEHVKIRHFLIGKKASIFVSSDVKYTKRSCSGHGTMIINIGQALHLLSLIRPL